jgi:hypothetical protein
MKRLILICLLGAVVMFASGCVDFAYSGSWRIKTFTPTVTTPKGNTVLAGNSDRKYSDSEYKWVAGESEPESTYDYAVNRQQPERTHYPF